MQEYHFNAALAQRYGVDGAVFLHAMAFWVAKNKANGRHFHEGRYWTYNTRKALAELFPFWTQRQLERIVNNLRDAGAVLVGNFSEDKADRTLWYALSNDVLEAYGESADPISPNGEMHFTDPCDPFHQTGKCNKETVTNQLYIPPISPEGGQGRKETKRGRSGKAKELDPQARAMLNRYVSRDPELTEAMQALMEVRQAPRSKAVNTARAIKTLLTELDKLSAGDRDTKLRIIRQSVMAGWAGLFPLRGGGGAGKPKRPREEGEDW